MKTINTGFRWRTLEIWQAMPLHITTLHIPENIRDKNTITVQPGGSKQLESQSMDNLEQVDTLDQTDTLDKSEVDPRDTLDQTDTLDKSEVDLRDTLDQPDTVQPGGSEQLESQLRDNMGKVDNMG